MSDAIIEIDFRGRWGFRIAVQDKNGNWLSVDSWSKDAFPMCTDPNSEWQREAVERFSLQAAEDLRKYVETLDSL